jgi:hypothetical protein
VHSRPAGVCVVVGVAAQALAGFVGCWLHGAAVGLVMNDWVCSNLLGGTGLHDLGYATHMVRDLGTSRAGPNHVCLSCSSVKCLVVLVAVALHCMTYWCITTLLKCSPRMVPPYGMLLVVRLRSQASLLWSLGAAAVCVSSAVSLPPAVCMLHD